MRGLTIVPLLGLAALLTACETMERQAASGGDSGAVVNEDSGRKSAEAMPGTSRNQVSQLSGQQVAEAQRVLKAHGYYRGNVDGIVGPRTREAVATYQRREGLPQTARLDPPTVDALMREQAAQGPAGGATSRQR